jgi:Tol biopolymer transport system component
MIGSVPGVNYFAASVSNDGALLTSGSGGRYRYTLSWLSRDGKELGTISKPDRYTGLRLSPDGSQVSLNIANQSAERHAWILDLGRGVQTRLPSTSQLGFCVWSPDGRSIMHNERGGVSIVEQDLNGLGSQKTVVQSDQPAYVGDFSPDGHYFIYEQSEKDTSSSLRVIALSPGADRKPQLYLKGRGNLSNPNFSPDGKWVAYNSSDSGQQEIYAVGFPTPSARVQVSSSGGNYVRWRKDGKELFYRALDGRLMSASVRATGNGLQFGTPAALFRMTEPTGPHLYPYDVSADGQRILALTPEVSEGTAPLTVFLNWQAALKK